jgi:hypothetical protein
MLNHNFHRQETDEFDDAQFTPWEAEADQPTIRLTFDTNDWLPDNLIPRRRFPFGQITTESEEITSNPMVHELLQLQRDQEEIEEQIRLLHLAHEELDEARNELMELLMHIDEDIGLEEVNIDEINESPSRLIRHAVELDDDEEEYNDDDDEDVDFEYLIENVGLGIDNDSITLSSSGPHGDFRMTFLDENGEECNGLIDTMRNAVGWINSKTLCVVENSDLDANGNELCPTAFHPTDQQR